MMSKTEKIDKAVELIRKAGIVNEIINPDEVYDHMRDMGLYEIAEDIADFVNLIYELRETLEEEP